MESSSDQHPVEALAEEFLARKRRGEHPALSEYAERYPEWADDIAEIFPAMELMEDFKPASQDIASDGSAEGEASIPELEQVADYRILKEIGRGGMGVVYEAEQLSLGRRVALKVLPRQSAGDGKALARFQREARAAAKMHHTNIVPVFEVGQDKEHVFYAMQLIQGQGLDFVISDLKKLRSDSLADIGQKGKSAAARPPVARSLAASLVVGEFQELHLLDSDADQNSDSAVDQNVDPAVYADTVLTGSHSTPTAILPGQSELSTAENDRRAYFHSVAEIGLQTARALSYAHARGIIHRDIKPSNLLLDTTGVVWVTDFGLAKTSDVGLTHTGDILGTLRYMSPERFKGQCDVRADIYSLGLTLYELLLLKPAFESPDRLKLIDMVAKTEAPSPRSIDHRIPRDLETIVLKASDKDPKRRYQSADDMADDLQHFVNDEPIKARRTSSVERVARWSRHNPWLATAMSVAMLALIAVAVVSQVLAQTEKKLNRDLVQSNAEQTRLLDEQKKLVEELQEVSEEQQKTNAVLTETNRTNEELIRDLKRSQSRLAEKQAEFIAEKGNIAESMLWLARSYELADGQKPGLRKNLLTKLEASAARMPRLFGVEVTGPQGGGLFSENFREAIQHTTVEERRAVLQELVNSGEVFFRGTSVMSEDQTLMAIPGRRREDSESDKPNWKHEIRVWDVGSAAHTGRTIRPLTIPSQLAVHAGKRLLAAVLWETNEAAAAVDSEGPAASERTTTSRIKLSNGSLTLCVWSIDSGELLLEHEIAADVQNSRTRLQSPIHFRSNGNEIVRISGNSTTTTQEITVKVHSVETGDVTHTAQISPEATGVVPAALISADGQRIVAVTAVRGGGMFAQGGMGLLTCHDIDSGEQVGETIRHSALNARTIGSRLCLVTPGGSRVAVLSGIGRSQRIEILDFESGGQVGGAIEVSRPASSAIRMLNANPDGTQLAVGVLVSRLLGPGAPASIRELPTAAGFTQVFNVETGAAVAPPLPTPGAAELLAMPDAEMTWGVRVGAQIRTWQLPHSQMQRVLIPWQGLASNQGAPTFATRMSTAARLAQGTASNSSVVTNVLSTPAVELAFDHQKNVIVAEQDQTGIHLRTWDRVSGRLLAQKKLPNSESSFVGMFSPGGEYLMTGHVGSGPEAAPQIQLWRPATGTKHGEPYDLREGHTPLAVNPDGVSVLFRVLERLQPPGESADESATPSQPESRSGAGSRTQRRTGSGFARLNSIKLVVVNLSTGDEQVMPLTTRGGSGHFSTDGRFVFFGSMSNQLRYDLKSGTLDPPNGNSEDATMSAGSNASGPFRGGGFTGNRGGRRGGFGGGRGGFGASQPRLADLSGDGMLVAAIVDDTVVQIRTVRTGGQLGSDENQVRELQHPSPLIAVAFDAETKLLITAATDGLIRQWSLPERWTGDADEIRQRVESHTGVALADTDEVVVTSAEANDVKTFGENNDQQQAPELLTSFATDFLTQDERDAIRFRNEGSWQEADTAFAKWAVLRPDDCQPHVLRIRSLVELKKFDEAHTAWDEAVKRIGRDAAFAWLKSDFNRQAVVPTTQTTASNAPRYNRLDADTAAIIGWYQRRILEFSPDDATSAAFLFQIAKIHEFEFEFDEAADAINRAIALDHDSADMHYYRAHLMERLNRWDEALESRKVMWRLEPYGPDSPYRVITAHLFAGDAEAFRKIWAEYLSGQKELLVGEWPNVSRRDRLAKSRLLAGGPRDESFQLALEIADANFEDLGSRTIQDWLRFSKGLAEYWRGEPENLNAAIKHLDTAFAGFQDSRGFQRGEAITRFIAAMAHHKLGEHELARSTYFEGLDRHLRDDAVRRQSTTSVANDWQQAEVARREAADLLKIDETKIDQPVPNTPEWKVLLEDDFDDGISEEWERMTGDWSVVDGAACGKLQLLPGGVPAYDRLEREIPGLSDTYEVEYETWTSDPMLAACFLRLPSEDSAPVGHRVALTSVPDRLFVTQGKPGTGLSLVTNTNFGSWDNQSVPDFRVEPNRHYKVRIIRQPERITVFIDGKEILSERVRNIETRSIRFFARGEEGTKMFVDNVKVRIPQEADADSGPKAEVESVN